MDLLKKPVVVKVFFSNMFPSFEAFQEGVNSALLEMVEQGYGYEIQTCFSMNEMLAPVEAGNNLDIRTKGPQVGVRTAMVAMVTLVCDLLEDEA